MPVARHIQTNFTAGEFDPLLAWREDVSFFYNSAYRLENVVPLPQGGLKRRGGMKHIKRQRGELSEITSSATITAPSGGTVSYLTDGSAGGVFRTTAALSTNTVYQIAVFDFGSAQRLGVVDMAGLRLENTPSATTTVTVSLEFSDDGITWSPDTSAYVLDEISVGTASYNRRLCSVPSGAFSTNHRYWRLSILNPSAADYGSTTVAIDELKIYDQAVAGSTGAPSDAKLFSMSPGNGSEYVLVASEYCVDIYNVALDEFVSSVPIDHNSSQISEIKTAVNRDSLVLYHKDIPPIVITNLGADADWGAKYMTFSSVVRYPFSTGAVSGGVDEVQYVNFESMATGDKFHFEYNGQSSAEIVWSGSVFTDIQTALNAMDDFSNVVVTDLGTGDCEIKWTGVDGKKPWAILVVAIVSGSGTANIWHKTYGRPDTDDLWSATRGYPRCGTFYQGRHWMGGFRDAPDVLVASRATDPTDFKEDADPIAVSPIVVAPQIDEEITITDIYAGRHLQIFTTSGEFYIPTEPITPDNIAIKAATRHGSNGVTQPVSVQGGTLFVERNGRAIREFLYLDAEQSYSAEPISLVAGHLVAQPRSIALRRPLDIDEPRMLLIANTGQDSDGNDVPAAMAVIDRAQQVTAFSRITTNGTVKSFATTQSGTAWALVERDLVGSEGPYWHYLSRLDADFMADEALEATNTEYDEYTATSGQTVFTYTFTSPATDADVAVWTRAASTDDWSRVSSADYTVNLGAQTVTFNTGRASGELIRVNKRQSTVRVSPPGHNKGETFMVNADRTVPLGEFTATATTVTAGDTIDLGSARWDFTVQFGYKFNPRVVLQAFKGRLPMSPTMKKQRIFRALVQMIKTGSLSVGTYGQSLKDTTILSGSAKVFTGTKRLSGLGKWEIEPRLEFSQAQSAPWQIAAITYDVRY